MSSITAADLKLGGRLVAACDAIGAGHLRRAAGIFNEIADDLNIEAESTDGLMADEGDLLAKEPEPAPQPPPQPQLQMQPTMASVDLQMCMKNVHNYGEVDKATGWRHCLICGVVNVAPPDQ